MGFPGKNWAVGQTEMCGTVRPKTTLGAPDTRRGMCQANRLDYREVSQSRTVVLVCPL